MEDLNRLSKVTLIFCLFFLLFTASAFYQTLTLYRDRGLEWSVSVVGSDVVVVESIWMYVGSCIFSCTLLLLLVANFDRVMMLEQMVSQMDDWVNKEDL